MAPVDPRTATPADAVTLMGTRPAQPVLVLPGVFSAELCDDLAAHHKGSRVRHSGFMYPDEFGKTREYVNPELKWRKDVYAIGDLDYRCTWALQTDGKALFRAFRDTPPPMLHIERHLIARYDAPYGHFAPHRDDFFPGTRHRQLAVSINLNDDFEGGALVLPESGVRVSAPKGAAVIFPCSALHAVEAVTAGSRFAYLTFLYDDRGEAIRQAEASQLGEPV